MHVLIIGYGNPLRGDDGFGWHVAGNISIPDCQVLTCHQLTPELAEDLSHADVAIFIDATVERRAERLTWRSLSGCRLDTPVEPCAGSQDKSRDESRLGRHECPRHADAFTHHVGIDALLSLARELYGHSPAAYVISAVGDDFDCGEKLSPAVAAVLEPAVKLVEQLIADFRRPIPTLS